MKIKFTFLKIILFLLVILTANVYGDTYYDTYYVTITNNSSTDLNISSFVNTDNSCSTSISGTVNKNGGTLNGTISSNLACPRRCSITIEDVEEPLAYVDVCDNYGPYMELEGTSSTLQTTVSPASISLTPTNSGTITFSDSIQQLKK